LEKRWLRQLFLILMGLLAKKGIAWFKIKMGYKEIAKLNLFVKYPE